MFHYLSFVRRFSCNWQNFKNVLLWHPVLLNPHLLELSSFRDEDDVSLNEIQESNFCVGHVHDSNNDA